MENNNKLLQKNFILLVIIFLVLGFLFYTKKHQTEVVIPKVETKETQTVPDMPKAKVTPVVIAQTEKDKTLAKLRESMGKEDYSSFGDALEVVYRNKWQNEESFALTESAFYVFATDKYYEKGNYDKTVEVSTIVYRKVPEAWRFRYLRIRALEALGRKQFNIGDLDSAEKYAQQILQMMFRVEGANLMADVYISRIKTNLKDGNKNLAKQNLGYIWDYEISQDRRDTLTELKKQIGE